MSKSSILAKAPEEIIADLFPVKVHTAFSELTGTIDDLYPEEAAIISKTVAKRQAEFASGRLSAKCALSKAGVYDSPILMDKNRAPMWPEGFTGSITHTNQYCAAVIAEAEAGQSLGLDVEEDQRLKPRIWPNSFVDDEIAWLFLLDEDGQENPVKWATLMFAAKEAFYKAQYPLTRAWVGFKDVKVEVSFRDNSFTVTLLRNIPLLWKKNTQFKGKYAFFEGSVVTGMWIDLQDSE